HRYGASFSTFSLVMRAYSKRRRGHGFNERGMLLLRSGRGAMPCWFLQHTCDGSLRRAGRGEQLRHNLHSYGSGFLPDLHEQQLEHDQARLIVMSATILFL
ncbi:hypothetical protein Dimus_015389, partial [Dionaea muscipula]